jgi:RES domain-containing protein
MQVYRLYQRRWRKDAFSGEGSRIFGARWNLPGVPAVYGCPALSLCLLELLVHLNLSLIRIDDLMLEYCSADISDASPILELSPRQLPAGWSAFPYTEKTQILGSRLLKENKYLAISFPSAIVPEEKILLINPRHQDFSKIAIHTPRPFRIEPRLKEKISPGK